ncbi:adenine-specific methyltransferase EcoRI family protein [Otariodibacter sp.]|uniref:adenine-specific methyltransferase EcoRI family protein n=1 Tax=Otariodibacter sp. TaxID=3030919 RepID=UPI00261C70F6|nr:adenine-specific methyltransferase EcoRI family protein [Otariodibacter sp.]
MSTNKNFNLSNAKKAKNDEFYTQYVDIEKEMQAYLDYDENIFRNKTILLPCDDPEWSHYTKYFVQNFSRLGLKKLISTSYAYTSKQINSSYRPSLLEINSSNFNEQKSKTKGKIFTLVKETNSKKIINFEDLKWHYMDGDGDFRSDEVKSLRDEADIIITNPPFSLFREFISWIISANKKFSIIGNMNAVTYKEVFPLIAKNKIWLGATINSGDREFQVPNSYPLKAAGFRIDNEGNKYIRVKGVRWFTNLEHGRRHQPLQLMTLSDNIRFNKQIANKNAYEQYDNYKAIEIPKTNAIPSDYQGIMGVPISFLDKYNPDQFEILGMDFYIKEGILSNLAIKSWQGKYDRAYINGKRSYSRILIKHK